MSKRTVRIPAGADTQTTLEQWLCDTALEDGVQVPPYLVSQGHGVSNLMLFVCQADLVKAREAT